MKRKSIRISLRIFLPFFISFALAGLLIYITILTRQKELSLNQTINALENEKLSLQGNIDDISDQLDDVKNQDQYLINKNLEAEIKNIYQTYKQTVSSYESLIKLKKQSDKTDELDEIFTDILTALSQKKYDQARSMLTDLTGKINKLQEEITASFVIPVSVPQSNSPPETGHSRQKVATDIGTFLVDIISADLGPTKVVVDSASDEDCHNDCPALPLSDYVGRNGGYAGINGSYFCPATYPSCFDRKNSFDTLLMNKNKKYLNSDNNKYSTVPAVIFLGSSIRFVGQSLEWGRDTGPDGVLANQPLLLMGGNIMFSGDGDPKKGSKGPRSFVANKGNVVYIGVVHNATVAESGHALKALELENALNLDSGGSTALYYNGYKAGPGRNIPNAIVFIKR